jgi:hypothetical protein
MESAVSKEVDKAIQDYLENHREHNPELKQSNI